MATIKFSTGQTVNFNGNPTQKDIDEVASKLGVEKKQNYFQRVASGYMDSTKGVISGINKGAEQIQGGINQGGVKGALNVAGGLARSGLRTVGGVAEAAFEPIVEAPGIKQGLEAIGTGISKIPGVDNIAMQLMDLSKKYPEVSKDIQNIIDIAVLGSGKTVEKPVATGLEKTGATLEKSGVGAATASKKNFALELVKPIETKASKLAEVGRTSERGGILKKDIVNPTKFEKEIAAEVSQIPKISSGNTFQKNFNLVRDYNVTKAEKLVSDVAKYDFLIPKRETLSRLNKSASELISSPLIVGDAEKMANKLINGAKKIIEENKGTGSGLLKARKEFDAWVKSQKPKVFDAKSDNAFTIANDAIRNTMNTMLDEKAINLGIKDSLTQQSRLYKAMENIAPKAAEEANTQLGRIMQGVGKKLGTRNKAVQGLAALTGIGVFGASAAYALPLTVATGLGFLLYKGGKLIINPQARIYLGKILETSGKLLSTEEKSAIKGLLNKYE